MRQYRIPVSIREYLSLLECLSKDVIYYEVEDFYFLSRSVLIKNEKHIDRFDKVFSNVFKGIENITIDDVFNNVEILEYVIIISSKHIGSNR